MERKVKEELAKYFEAPEPIHKREFLRGFGAPKMNTGYVIIGQARYVSKGVWCFSLFFFLVALWAALQAEQKYVNVVQCFVPFLVMISVTESTRSYCYGMEELELAARFSLKSIIMARMLVLGLGNMLVMSGALLLMNGKVQINPVYLLTPYFLTAAGGLYITRSVRGKENSLLCFGLSAFISVMMWYMPWQFQGIFLSQNVWIWVIFCLIGVMLTVRESVHTIRMTQEMA